MAQACLTQHQGASQQARREQWTLKSRKNRFFQEPKVVTSEEVKQTSTWDISNVTQSSFLVKRKKHRNNNDGSYPIIKPQNVKSQQDLEDATEQTTHDNTLKYSEQRLKTDDTSWKTRNDNNKEQSNQRDTDRSICLNPEPPD